MTAAHHVAVATSGMEVKHDMVYRPDATAQVISEDDVLLIKAEPVVSGPTGALVIQQTHDELHLLDNRLQPRVQQQNYFHAQLKNGLVSVATSAGSVLTQQQANGSLSNGPFSSIGNNSGSPAASKQRRPAAPDDWLSSPSPSGGAPSLTPSPGPPAFTVISNGYSSPLSSGSYDPYSPNGKIGKFNNKIIFDFYLLCSFIKKLKSQNEAQLDRTMQKESGL